MQNQRQMKFSTRLLMVTTPIGVALGLYEAWQLAGGLAILVGAQILIMGAAAVALVRRVREEAR